MPETEQVEQVNPEVAEAVNGKVNGKAKDETVTLSKAEAESKTRELEELRESARYWMEQARGGKKEPEPEQNDDPEPESFLSADDTEELKGDTPDKLVEEFTAQGVGALKKRGFITATDAKKMAAEIALKVSREIVNRERQKISSDSQIMAAYPELRNPESALFKETAELMKQAARLDPNAFKSPATLYAAAAAAKAKLEAATPARRPRQEDDYDRYEDDRASRIAAQDGSRRGRVVEEDDDMLGPEARLICKQMGVSEEDFLKSQRELGRNKRRAR